MDSLGAGLARLAHFEDPAARRLALLLLLAVALVSPDVPMPGGLPALRLEQALLALLLPSLVLFYRRHPEYRRITAVDLAFLGLGAAMVVTLTPAPAFVEKSAWSLRDPFELARLAEYWRLFRLGFTVWPEDTTAARVLQVLFIGAVGLTLFSLVQYLHPGQFNSTVTDVWTVPHNLDGVELTGRVVGTVGNANYYGILSGLFLFLALATMVLREPLGRGWRWLPEVAVAAATLSVVMSQSRTAVVAMLGAMTIALLVVVVLRRRLRASYGPAIGLFVASAAISIGFVELVPPRFESFHQRFSPQGLGSDASLTTRLSRWRALFSGFFDEDPAFCQGQRLENRRRSSGHATTSPTGAPAASVEALARDRQRKADIGRLSRGVLDYFCEVDRWPVGEPLATALVPRYLAALPADPLTGEPSSAYVDQGGFTMGARLEDASDPEGPLYTLGTIPNMVLNASFEDKGEPKSWQAQYGGRANTTTTQKLFGGRAVSVLLTPSHGNPPRRGSVYQRVVFGFPQSTDFSASLWARSESGREQSLQLYLIGSLSNADLIDPLASIDAGLPADGTWSRVELLFRTPDSGRMVEMLVMVFSPTADGSSRITLDGAIVAQGAFAPGFALVEDVDPARLRRSELPHFSDSPIIGVGPAGEAATSSFDNEYVLFLDRWGIVGTLFYLGLFGGALVTVYRAWSGPHSALSVLALGMLTFTVALAVFNIAAGSYYHFQIMAIYWLLVGLLAAARGPGLEPAVARVPALAPVPTLPAGRALPEPPGLESRRG